MINPTEYLPRSYHTRVSTYWWLKRWAYLKFILREASSVFVAWTDVQDGTCAPQSDLEPFTPCHNSDVRLAVSHDRGETWSAPVKPTDESGESDQFFPWLAAHPDGLVSLAWLDRRLDPRRVDVRRRRCTRRQGLRSRRLGAARARGVGRGVRRGQ